MQKQCSRTDITQVRIKASFAARGTSRRAAGPGGNRQRAAGSPAGPAMGHNVRCITAQARASQLILLPTSSQELQTFYNWTKDLLYSGTIISCHSLVITLWQDKLPWPPKQLSRAHNPPPTPPPPLFFPLFFFFLCFMLILFSLGIELPYCKYACKQKGGREMGTGAWGRREGSFPCPRQLKLFVKQQPELRQPRWCVKSRKYLQETYWTLSKYPSLK